MKEKMRNHFVQKNVRIGSTRKVIIGDSMRKYKDKPKHIFSNHDHEYECSRCGDLYETDKNHVDTDFCSYECNKNLCVGCGHSPKRHVLTVSGNTMCFELDIRTTWGTSWGASIHSISYCDCIDGTSEKEIDFMLLEAVRQAKSRE